MVVVSSFVLDGSSKLDWRNNQIKRSIKKSVWILLIASRLYWIFNELTAMSHAPVKPATLPQLLLQIR